MKWQNDLNSKKIRTLIWYKTALKIKIVKDNKNVDNFFKKPQKNIIN
jgi:hypothetical protein